MNRKDLRDDWLAKADVLTEALPFMRRYAGKRVVIKYGGHAMGDRTVARLFAQDIVLLKQVGIHPIIVHGGGPQIGDMLKRLEIKSDFVDGLRVTDSATVEVVEMVLAGRINKEIVALIQGVGGRAVGLSGKDGGMIQARKLTRTRPKTDSNIEKNIDLGFVGEPSSVDPTLLEDLLHTGFIPVIAPLGLGEGKEGEQGQTFNINADTAAGAIAGALRAERLLMLTDIEGVLDGEGALLRNLSPKTARSLIAEGTIAGGMIPKVQTCLDAVAAGAKAAVILDGRVPHALLLEIFTTLGAGTYVGD